MRRAAGSNACPAPVSPPKRLVRSKRLAPNSRSSWRIWAVNAGWTKWSLAAAREKCISSATAKHDRSHRSSTDMARLLLVFGPRLSAIVQNFYYSLLYAGPGYVDAVRAWTIGGSTEPSRFFPRKAPILKANDGRADRNVRTGRGKSLVRIAERTSLKRGKTTERRCPTSLT